MQVRGSATSCPCWVRDKLYAGIPGNHLTIGISQALIEPTHHGSPHETQRSSIGTAGVQCSLRIGEEFASQPQGAHPIVTVLR